MDHGGERPVVIAAAWRPLPRGLAPGQHLTAALETIAALTESRTARGRRVVTALQPSQFQIKSIRLPRLPPEELESAVMLEAEERFAFGDDGGEFRFVSAGE